MESVGNPTLVDAAFDTGQFEMGPVQSVRSFLASLFTYIPTKENALRKSGPDHAVSGVLDLRCPLPGVRLRQLAGRTAEVPERADDAERASCCVILFYRCNSLKPAARCNPRFFPRTHSSTRFTNEASTQTRGSTSIGIHACGSEAKLR